MFKLVLIFFGQNSKLLKDQRNYEVIWCNFANMISYMGVISNKPYCLRPRWIYEFARIIKKEGYSNNAGIKNLINQERDKYGKHLCVSLGDGGSVSTVWCLATSSRSFKPYCWIPGCFRTCSQLICKFTCLTFFY